MNQNLAATSFAEPTQQRWLLWLAALLLLAQGLLVYNSGWHGGFSTINDAGRLLSDRFAESLTQLGDSLLALSLFLFLAKRYPALLWQALLAALIATLLSHGIKSLAAQPRPAALLELDSFRQLGPVLRRGSYPSGHTVTAFVSAACVACYLTAFWQRALLLIAALAVGFSRVAVGAHWPVDVCAGAACGLFSAYLGLLLARRWPLGLKPGVHQAVVLILAGCTLAQLFMKPEYPLARPLIVAISLLALAVAARDYLLPRLSSRTLADS